MKSFLSPRPQIPPKPQIGGFSLVEIVLALGIVSFTLVAVLGLFTVGLNRNRESSFSIDAANAASSIIGMWTANPSTDFYDSQDGLSFVLPASTDLDALPTSPGEPASVMVDDSGYRVSDPARARFRAYYWLWKVPNLSSASATHFRLRLVLAWPAQATDLEKSAGFYETAKSVSFATPPQPPSP